ncbi:MAG: class I SAM-dependent methyltransferase [Planctomycetota bacterium]|nr:class I SAM-dependent methyltransferase [Planctomycetota bacterium]MDA1114258.1 class I SAM-dependent methyltransferase [Planctomycetota bacterium]
MERVLEPEVMDSVEDAEGYDAMDHSGANDAFIARLLELGVHGRVLDIGCGPGHIALQLVTQKPELEVVGVDLSENMLKIAEEHKAVCAQGDRVEFLIADAKGLDFPDDSFDTVCSNSILHHIPDPVPFLREAWRVLKPGGVFLIRDLFRPDDVAAATALVDLHAANEAEYARELFHASLCAAFTPDEFVDIARAAGISGAEVVEDSDRHMSLQTETE